MLLVSISMMARASCITTYCPRVEDIELPPEALWDDDGLPQWIELGLFDWKCRRKKNRNKRYGIRLHRNYVNTRFCPVTWLLTYLHAHGIKSGPIFQKEEFVRKEAGDPESFSRSIPTGENMSPDQWTTMTERLFIEAGLYTKAKDDRPSKGCTNHSIRRSAAQWAGRCGAQELWVRNNGRWKTMEELVKYMGQGAMVRDKAIEANGGGDDPIRQVWWYKPVTVASYDGNDAM